MKRRKFLEITGGSLLIAAGTAYLFSDKNNLVRSDIKEDTNVFPLLPDERFILYHASLAPSGHNTQPWFIKYVEPYHWIICNDKNKWLPAVDPTQRETILSIGAFMQNLEYAAQHAGYACRFDILASANQDEAVAEVRLVQSATAKFDIAAIQNRRTVRSAFLTDVLSNADIDHITGNDKDHFHFIANNSKEYQWLNEQTIEANRVQTSRDAAQKELAEWIRFSGATAKKYRDGLTTAGMEIEGIPGWVVRNFYTQEDVMGRKFRQQTLDKVNQQVNSSAGWLLVTGAGNSPATLLETGMRFQQMFLKIRDKNIAIHPMTQILEEPGTRQEVNTSTGINENIQFILRTGYIKTYPEPASLRRPVDWFVRKS